MKRVTLQRYKGDNNQTTGVLMIFDYKGWPVYASPCIERGYRDNQRNVSNVPMGIYPLILEWSPKFEMYLWELKDVPNRSECKIHAANYWKQLNGCISPGSYLKDLNKDGYQDVAASKRSLNNFHKVMKQIFPNGEATIQIIEPIEAMPF